MRLDINVKINMLYGTNLVCLFSERQTKKMKPIPVGIQPFHSFWFSGSPYPLRMRGRTSSNSFPFSTFLIQPANRREITLSPP